MEENSKPKIYQFPESPDDAWKSVYKTPEQRAFYESLSPTAQLLARKAAKASRLAVIDAWEHGLSVTVLEGEDIVQIAPDGTRTFVKKLEPLGLDK